MSLSFLLRGAEKLIHSHRGHSGEGGEERQTGREREREEKESPRSVFSCPGISACSPLRWCCCIDVVRRKEGSKDVTRCNGGTDLTLFDALLQLRQLRLNNWMIQQSNQSTEYDSYEIQRGRRQRREEQSRTAVPVDHAQFSTSTAAADAPSSWIALLFAISVHIHIRLDI